MTETATLLDWLAAFLIVSIGSATATPGGVLPGRNSTDRSAREVCRSRWSMRITPSFTSGRVFGQATEGSSIASPAPESCAYQVKRIGPRDTRSAISSER